MLDQTALYMTWARQDMHRPLVAVERLASQAGVGSARLRRG
jgi:hypothetical protein